MDVAMILALLLAAAAACAAWIRIRQRGEAKALGNWIRAEGRVLEARIEESSASGPDGAAERWYDPQIVYEYEAAGATRRGTGLALQPVSFRSRKKAEQYLDARPVGSTVPVYFDPRDPEQSVLAANARQDWFGPAFLLLLAVLVGSGAFGG